MQKSLIYIDVLTRSQITPNGDFVKKSSDYFEVERGQWQVLCIQFVQRTEDELGTVTLTNYALSTTDTFLFIADSDFEDDNSLMLKSFQSTLPFDESNPESNRFNLEGDWIDGSTADMAQGQMSIRINSDTEKFKTTLGNKKSVTSGLYINIKQYMSGFSNPSNIAWFNFTALNTIRDWGEPEELPPEGTTLVPFISSYLKNKFEFEFSIDGESWHSMQTIDDRYYRQRIANINADWSGAIEMIEGQGVQIDAAGTLENRTAYDAESAGFAYFATDTRLLYIKNSDTSADWSEGFPIYEVTYQDISEVRNKADMAWMATISLDDTKENKMTAVDLSQWSGNELDIIENVPLEGGNYYYYDNVMGLSIASVEETLEEIILHISFYGGSIIFPDTLQWIGTPSFEAGKTYVISIVNNIAVAGEIA